MTQKQDTTKMDAMLWQFMAMEDPMLGMLEWLCSRMMEIEVTQRKRPINDVFKNEMNYGTL
jgi:hypothetical protein